MTTTDDFYDIDVSALGEGGPAEPTDRYGRKILPRGDGTAVAYTRATTLSDSLGGGVGLQIWTKYRAVWGVAQRDELIARLRAVPVDDKATIREVCSKAELIGGTEADADNGTAAHAVLQRLDQGVTDIDGIHPYYQPLARNYQAALQEHGITVLPAYVERTCRYARYDLEGHPDNIYQLDDGSLVIGDKKTCADLEKSERSIAAQLAIYANCEHMMNYETGQYEPMPDVRKDFALIIAIDTDTWAVTVERLDIIYGLGRVRLAAELRESNKVKGIRHPYVAAGHWTHRSKTVLPPEAPATNGKPDPARVAQIAAATIAESHARRGFDPTAAAVQTGPVRQPDTSPTAQVATMPTPPPASTVGPTATTTPPPRIEAVTPTTHVVRPAAVDPDTRVQEIMEVRRNDKTRLQQWAKSLGCTDLSHHRKWLAEWIVKATPDSGAIEPTDKINLSENNGGENPRSLTETGLPPAPAAPPGQPVVGPGTNHPVVDLTETEIVSQLHQAMTFDALNDIWQRWTDAYGRDAWAGAVKEAADQQANFIRARLSGDDGPPF